LVKNVSLHQFMASAFIFFIIWINVDLLYALIPNGNVYVDAKFVVFILALVKIVNTSFNVGATVLSYSKYYYYSLVFTVILTATAIFMNIKFIPIGGMEGAAMASLLSYIVYYMFLLTFVRLRIKVTPFSLNELYTLVIIVSLFVIDWLLRKYISDYVVSLFDINLLGQLLDSVIRTLILSFLGIVTIYKFRISKQVNDIIDKILSFLKLI